jgi:hypothetical protein
VVTAVGEREKDAERRFRRGFLGVARVLTQDDITPHFAGATAAT